MPTGIRRPARNSLTVFLVCLAFASFSAPAQAAPGADSNFRLLIAEEPHMGVVVRISAYIPAGVDPPRVFRRAFDRVEAVTRRFSSYDSESELRRVERLAWREQTSVSPEFARVLAQALWLARESGGAFDPTLGRVTRLLRGARWGRAGPSEDRLRNAWHRTGWSHVELDASNLSIVFTKRGLQLDLGGIAKGYAADEALAALRRAGVDRAMVAVAGDIAVGDPPPSEHGWLIGLDSLGPRGSIESSLKIANQGISTSGSRDRYYLVPGGRCSHIVSRAGNGCTDTALAVTVVAPTAMEADGLATALISLGESGAESLLRRRKDVLVYWSPGGSPAAAEK